MDEEHESFPGLSGFNWWPLLRAAFGPPQTEGPDEQGRYIHTYIETDCTQSTDAPKSD